MTTYDPLKTMQPTPYPDVNKALYRLLRGMQAILGERLVGLYLFGSLVMGDFDTDTSDIDLLAAIQSDLTEIEFEALDKLHQAVVAADNQWDNRLEIDYFSLHGLRTFRTETSKMGIISPGEPFHIIDSGIDRLLNWYIVRENGKALYGPPPNTLIDPISKTEFIDVIKLHMREWRAYINEMVTRPSQAYAILTMCRGLYALTYGEQTSKLKAAQWAAEQMPEWAVLIHNALIWRKNARDPNMDHEATRAETHRFVHLMLDKGLAIE